MSAQVTRRQALGIAGATGAALLLRTGPGGSVAPGLATDEALAASCVLTPAKTEGPYFVDEKLNRSDIRAGEDGVTLALTIQVVDADRDCAPVAGATVDVWHANAGGTYSDVAQNGTVGTTYLRGYQVTGSDGKATFTTIFPGWYRGRAIHLHHNELRVHVAAVLRPEPGIEDPRDERIRVARRARHPERERQHLRQRRR